MVNSTGIVSRIAGVNYRSVIVVVISVVVIRVTHHFPGYRIVAIPIVWVAAIPVITAIAVIKGPVSAQADKDISSVIIRIEISKREVRPPVIVHNEPMRRQDRRMAYLVVVIYIYMLVFVNICYNMGTFAIPPMRCPFPPAVHSIFAGHPSFTLMFGGTASRIRSSSFPYGILATFLRRPHVPALFICRPRRRRSSAESRTVTRPCSRLLPRLVTFSLGLGSHCRLFNSFTGFSQSLSFPALCHCSGAYAFSISLGSDFRIPGTFSGFIRKCSSTTNPFRTLY